MTLNNCIGFTISKISLFLFLFFGQYMIIGNNDPYVTAQHWMQLSDKWLEQENIDSSLIMADSAFFYADKIANPILKADLLFECGARQRRIGNTRIGHQYLYSAIDLYKDFPECSDKISSCYIELSNDYLFFNDIAAISAILKELELLKQKSGSPTISFNYYICKANYLFMKFTNENTNSILLDSAKYYYEKANVIYEKNTSKIVHIINPTFNYYKLALCYIVDSIPNREKINFYIQKMEQYLPDNYLKIEIQIGISYLKALEYMCLGEADYAEKELKSTLTLLETLHRKSINRFKINFYYYLASIYYEKHDYEKAIHYYFLYDNNFVQSITADKTDALNNLAFQYERAKKEQEIINLNKEKENARKLSFFFFIILIILALSLIPLFLFFRLKRKNLEQISYENILVAEMQKEMAVKNQLEKELLQEKYQKLEELSKLNSENANLYKNQLEELTKTIKENPFHSILNKIIALIQDSIIFPSEQKKYIQDLKALNVDELNLQFIINNKSLTTLEIRYLICFMIEMDMKDISFLFDVEIKTVYMVKYRLKKKLKEEFPNIS